MNSPREPIFLPSSVTSHHHAKVYLHRPSFLLWSSLLLQTSLVVLFLLLPFSLRGEGGEGLFAECPPLPEILVQIGTGSVTREEYRACLCAAAAAFPSLFGLEDTFLRDTILFLEKKRLGIPTPSAPEVVSRVEAECRQGGAELANHLRQLRITPADLCRAAERAILFEALVRARRSTPAILSEEVCREVEMALWKEAQPQYYGMHQPVTAVIQGRHISREEVLDYCLLQGRDAVLTDLLESAVNEALLRGEAHRRGWTGGAWDEETLLAILFEKETTDAELQAFYEDHRDRFLALRIAHIFLPFDRRRGYTYIPGIYEPSIVEKTKEHAEAIATQIRNGVCSFEEAARRESQCPSASRGGDLGYLVASREIAEGIPPSAYLFDDRLEGAAPLGMAPDEAIWKAAQKLREGEITGPIRCATGFSIVKRIEGRYPRDIKRMLDFLRHLRTEELKADLLQRLRMQEKIVYLWHPTRRDRWQKVSLSHVLDNGDKGHKEGNDNKTDRAPHADNEKGLE